MKDKHILHLYNRIGFGITPRQILLLKNKTKKEVVHKLFKVSKNAQPLLLDFVVDKEDVKDKKSRAQLRKKNRKRIKDYNIAWIHRLFNPKELLREKMTLFWANHFVCEDNNFLFTQQYHNLLRKNALGNFGEFVKKISKEPAMLKYLNNKKNVKKRPNENFARELMELFTLGLGNYTEKDIKESARAFTGYNYNDKGDFILKENKHDYGEKEFMGKKGNFNGDDIINRILENKQCARFISEKIYTYFVNDKINKKHIDKMVSVFFPKYNIQELMEYVLLSEWFYTKENIGVKIKSPIEFLIGINTVVPFTIKKAKHIFLIQRLLGQTLLNPPNVAGWKGGQNWIDSNTIVNRLRLPSVVLNNVQITYSDKGDFEDVITDFDENKLNKKTEITTKTNWDVFDENYINIKNIDLISLIISGKISAGTIRMLDNNKDLPKHNFCLQLLSLPEYQLC